MHSASEHPTSPRQPSVLHKHGPKSKWFVALAVYASHDADGIVPEA